MHSLTSVNRGGEEGVEQVWTVRTDKTDDKLVIRIRVIADVTEDLGWFGLVRRTAWRLTCETPRRAGSSDSR